MRWRVRHLIIFLAQLYIGLSAMEATAQERADSLRSVLESTHNDSIRIEALIDLSLLYSRTDTQIAYGYLRDLIKVSERTGSKWGLLNAYNRLGNMAQNAGRYVQSIIHYRDGIGMTDDSIQVARLLGGIGASKYFLNELDSAEYYMRLGFQIKLRHDPEEKKSLATSLLNLASIAERRNDTKRELEYLLEAKDIFESSDDRRGLGVIYNNLGTTYRRLDDPTNRLKYARLAYDIAQEINDKRILGNSAINLGNYYWDRDSIELSLKYYEEAVSATRTIGQRYDLSNALRQLGRAYIAMNDGESGRVALNESLEISSELDLPEFRISVLNDLAKLALEDDDASEAIKITDQAVEEAIAYDYFPVMVNTLRQAMQTYNVLGYSQKSMALFDQYTLARDSLFAGRQNEIVKDLQIKYDTKEKEAQLALNALEIEEKTNQRNLYLVLLLSVVVAGTVLVYSLDKRRKLLKKKAELEAEKAENLANYQKILSMDSMLQGQEAERQRIAQDLHDGLGTVLAAARMQMTTIQREIDKLGEMELVGQTEELIAHACKEVRRISHDMMPGSLADLGLMAAIEDLVENIKSGHELIFILDLSDEVVLEDARALNVYRIIQEIFMNIVKHAKANIVEVMIQVTDDYLIIAIEDDGIGFDLESFEVYDGIGLRNIKSRLNYLGSTYIINTSPGNGTAYKFEIPIMDQRTKS